MDRFFYFDEAWWARYKPSNISICHDRLAIVVGEQVGHRLEVEVNAEGVYRDILQILVSELFHADIANHVDEQFLIFLGGQAGHPRLFISSLNGTITAKVARIVELLLKAYKKAMGQRSDGCKAAGGGDDSKDKEGGELLLASIPQSNAVNFKDKHWMMNQELIGLDVHGLEERALVKRIVGESAIAGIICPSEKKLSDKVPALERSDLKGLEVIQNLRGLDLISVPDTDLVRRTVCPFSLVEMIASSNMSIWKMGYALEKLVRNLRLEEPREMTVSMASDELKKKEARQFYKDVMKKMCQKYGWPIFEEFEVSSMYLEEKARIRAIERRMFVERRMFEEEKRKFEEKRRKCEEWMRKRKRPFGKPKKRFGGETCHAPKSEEELELASGTSRVA